MSIPLIRAKAALIAREIDAAAERALNYAFAFVSRMQESMKPFAPDIWKQSASPWVYLPSYELRDNVRYVLADPANVRILVRHEWGSESFAGDDLAYWFEANQFSTVFDFQEKRLRPACAVPPDTEKNLGAWPWGQHETVLLRALASAAQVVLRAHGH